MFGKEICIKVVVHSRLSLSGKNTHLRNLRLLRGCRTFVKCFGLFKLKTVFTILERVRASSMSASLASNDLIITPPIPCLLGKFLCGIVGVVLRPTRRCCSLLRIQIGRLLCFVCFKLFELQGAFYRAFI